MLGAIWGFTRPFERIWRFWRIDFIRNSQKSGCLANCVKSDSRRLQILPIDAGLRCRNLGRLSYWQNQSIDTKGGVVFGPH